MLPEDIVKPLVALLTVALTFSPFLDIPLSAAGDFGESMQQGREQGLGFSQAYNPLNLEQTLENKGLGTSQSLTPQIDEARQTEGDYTRLYDNPGGLGAQNTDTDLGAFVKGI